MKRDTMTASALWFAAERHLEGLRVGGYSETTVVSRRGLLMRFIRWCEERSIDEPQQVTLSHLQRYQRHLYHYRKDDGQPLSVKAQAQCLTALRVWFRWLARQRDITTNPAQEIELPKQPKRLPRAIPNIGDVAAILNAVPADTVESLRDRALLELLYATGLRRRELANVAVYDVDLSRGLLMVRAGKGNKDRMVPLGERASSWVEKYLIEARPELNRGAEEALFLNRHGKPMLAGHMAKQVKRAMKTAGIETAGSLHLLRHACATHMLEGGADIRFIQELLGHANLQTTEIYTHVTIGKLIEVHKATHPSRLRRHTDDFTPKTSNDTTSE